MRILSAAVLLFSFLGSFCSPFQAQNRGFKVEPYLQFGTKNSMVVLWETNEKATTRVEYVEASFDVGVLDLYRSVELKGARTMHEVNLENLMTETNYFWRTVSVTESGDSLISQVYSFKTSVNDSTAYMFALVGDSQENSRTPWAWSKIAHLVWKDRPNFVVHAGDIVDNGNDLDDWIGHFFPGGHELMSRIPVYTVLGNHENDSPYYYQYMANPAPEYYYTFKYGNAQFFMIDTNRDVTEGSEQYNWLEWQLAKSDAVWKVVVHHHPPYSSEENDHGDTYKEASTYGTHARNLVPLFEKYGVDFDLFGHTHVYERTWPLKNNRVNQKDGVIYINSGGAGGGLEDFAPTRSWFTVELQTVHHYCTFAIYDRTLIYKAIDVDGNLFDTFQLTKPESDKKYSTAKILQPPAPVISPKARVFDDKMTITLEAAFEDNKIFYTTDGSEPGLSSKLYSKPFDITTTTTLKVRAYTTDNRASRISSAHFRKVEPVEAVNAGKTSPGLSYSYYEEFVSQIPDFSALKVKSTGIAPAVSLDEFPHRDEGMIVVFEGFIDIKEEGRYTFFTNTDDGSRLYLHDDLIVDNDRTHGMTKVNGEVILKKGKHPIRIEYFNKNGGYGLIAGYKGPDFDEKPFPPFILSHK